MKAKAKKKVVAKKKTAPKAEKPLKTNRYAKREDLEDAAGDEGEAIGIPVDTEKDGKTKKAKSKMAQVRHEQVIKRVAEDLGQSRKPNIYQTMIDAGYSESYARSGQLPKSKSWQDLMDHFMPDDYLNDKLKTLQNAKKIDYMLFTPEISDEDIYDLINSTGSIVKKIVHGMQGTHVWFFTADNTTQFKSVELGHKLKGKMVPEVIEVKGKLQGMKDEELVALIHSQKKKFTKTD